MTDRPEPATPKRPRDRPAKPVPKIDASPERIARAFFSAAKPPDPSLRVRQPKERKPAAQ